MDFITTVLYGMIAYRAFFGAMFCAVAPLFRKTVRHPNYLGLLLAYRTTSRMPASSLMTAGCWLFAVATVYILSGIHVEERDLVALFRGHHSHHRQHVWMLSAGRLVDGPVETRQVANQIPVSRSQTAHQQRFEDWS
jgi:protein-S-isoprenylcysteine O-methyltransferase Ste14